MGGINGPPEQQIASLIGGPEGAADAPLRMRRKIKRTAVGVRVRGLIRGHLAISLRIHEASLQTSLRSPVMRVKSVTG